MKMKLLTQISTPRIVAFSFMAVILAGSILLMLPISSASGQSTDFLTALFTATSATCVTGLVVVNTAVYWSFFGKMIILILIQIGGIGLMTIIATAFVLARKKIGILERKILKESAGNMELQGVVALVLRIVRGTFLFELAGAILLSIRFVPTYGLFQGIWFSIFHSISAFCNAGFDITGESLVPFAKDPLVLGVIMLLIVIGGIGFLVWSDMSRNRLHFNKYSLHTKIVLITTAILLVAGTVAYLIFESRGNVLGEGTWNRFLSALFLSVSTRTAGFNSVDMTGLSEQGSLITILLMFIGGSPASTAGGIKTTTVAVIILAVASLSKGESNVNVFNKSLKRGILSQATVVLTTYFFLAILGTLLVSFIEQIPVVPAAVEIVSAEATVGLSLGVTSSLGNISRTILILLMFAGRIGGFTFILVLRETPRKAIIKKPVDKVLIG